MTPAPAAGQRRSSGDGWPSGTPVPSLVLTSADEIAALLPEPELEPVYIWIAPLETVLASPEVIAALMPVQPAPDRVRGQRKQKGTRCLNHKCGVCVGCLDDQRWDAIYKAKFEDEDYYKLHVGIQSSLGTIMFPVVNADIRDRDRPESR